MPEIRKEIKRYFMVHMECECGEGNMIPTGMVFESYPPQYPHKCEKCGTEEFFWKQYPVFDTEDV